MILRKLSCAVIAAGIAALLSGCHIYKKYETPQTSALTRAYVEARQTPADSTAFGNLLWENVFTDPLLADFINRALENNKDLNNARLNVEIAHAQMQGARLSYLPSIALAPNGAGASYAGSDISWTYQLPAQVSWEIDIFGKILNRKRNAEAAYRMSEEYARATRSQIISAVAYNYYAIAAVNSQLELSRATAKTWGESVEVMKNLKLAGRVTEAAVVQSTAQYYSIQASITDLEVQLDQLNNTMSLLLNELPQNWNIKTTLDFERPAIVRASIPMSELATRPDVAAAEQALAVAYYATNSARAAFYPGISITANGGFTNLLGSFIKNPGDWFYQLAGSLAIPLFARGQNIAGLKAAKAQQKQALNNFEYALLNASAEVSDALTVYEKSAEKERLLIEQVKNLEKSVEYTNDLLQYSTGTYLEVLTAQQNLLGAQTAFISSRLSQARAFINLYQALGGGR
ncbi:MAG: TolC family protein [Muribaculaceae bacterium]|nr:TolC family protein [Muribaculaceae bacterium]